VTTIALGVGGGGLSLPILAAVAVPVLTPV
jgi:hypothetical protein